MWRRTYLLLLALRVYFALSPSYLHPDENFQGPEVFAGHILSYPSDLPWEFTTQNPIRSVFPLLLVYDVPIRLLKWFYTETGTVNPPPQLVYYVLRGVMFLLSFVLEDWVIYELVPVPRHRRATVVLVASSYVTWTYQTHTFSNSLETLLVAWGLVLIRRIVENKSSSQLQESVDPDPPHHRPFSLLSFVGFGLCFLCVAIVVDTTFYRPSASFGEILRAPIIAPLNNLWYNSDSANLALHGLHPHYQHFLVNLPQLLGPAFVMMVLSLRRLPTVPSWLKNTRAVSAISATAMLSVFPHQEPRFLIPCVPLLLSCFRMRRSRLFLISWVGFNAVMGFLMGVYHQGGVIPAQLALPSIISTNTLASVAVAAGQQPPAVSATVLWWKTYSPPRWLLGDNSSVPLDIHTRDLMGVPGPDMADELERLVPSCDAHAAADHHLDQVYVVAPRSATFLDQYTPSRPPSQLELHELWSYSKHLNLDDLDFGSDGVVPTLRRAVGRRGLVVWEARRAGCS
ncbi:conserved hypothetical protein [Aspergillus terreus NIH2624]|uniref:Mannosyltransferase n=1 Tax=Aspergillus terreus (strain NIH 2624 / FGSC A1156) TaxID=341663 RepID=Q0CA58_ASPTN|nr:uncharacterized protein ATEG_09426 [Aspergillus terreus NIH2624]EAU30563.1 conserved hypothetical protein [Aspergillus terreus NIH2624]